MNVSATEETNGRDSPQGTEPEAPQSRTDQQAVRRRRSSMIQMWTRWYQKYLRNEEAMVFAVLLAVGLVLILTMGGLLGPLLTSVVVAFCMQGIINFLIRRRFPERAAIGITYLVFLGGFFAFFFFVVPLVWRQLITLFRELPNMAEKGQRMIESLPTNYPYLFNQQQLTLWMDRLGDDIPQVGQWLVSFSLSQIPLVISLLLYMVMVPILVFFLLKDKRQIIEWTVAFLPKDRPLMNRVTSEMNVQMGNYVRGKVIEIILCGGATYLLFFVFRMNYAALLAFLVGLSVIIPYVGIAVVSVPVLLIAYIQFGLTQEFVHVMLIYAIIQGLDGFVLVPLLFSEAVNLHPVAIIASLLIFGGLWGLWGVFFAIPLATLIKSLIVSWPRIDMSDLA